MVSHQMAKKTYTKKMSGMEPAWKQQELQGPNVECDFRKHRRADPIGISLETKRADRLRTTERKLDV